MNKLLALLQSIKPDVDFSKEKHLIDDGVLDSMDIVAIIAAINEEYDVQFPVMEIQPERFNTIEGIYEVIEELLED